jgi:hypothetical protein
MVLKRMAARAMTVCLALSMLFTQAAAAAGSATAAEQQGGELPYEQNVSFSDLQNSYAREAVNRLAAVQLISGQGGDRFYPQKPMTRQDVAVLLAKVMGVQPKLPKQAVFADVPADSPYAPYVYALAELGVMQGRSDGKLGAADPLTRQEMAVLLTRLWKAGGGQMQSADAAPYADEEEIADYARQAVTAVTAQRWMQGAGGKFRPQGTVTRGDAAIIAERVLNARSQQAEQAEFTLNAAKLSVMTGTSTRVEVAPTVGTLPFSPVFAFDRPELGTVLPDGTFVAGPTPGKGTLTVTVGYRTKEIPVEITAAPAPQAQDAVEPDKQLEETGGEVKADTAAAGAEKKAEAGASETDKLAAGEANKPAETAQSDDGVDGDQTGSDTTPAAADQDGDGSEPVSQPAEEDGLINFAPGSFTSVQTMGKPDAYFAQVEKQYPGPVGGLVTPSEIWTGYYRLFGRKVTVALDEVKRLERVTLTFQQQKGSGITMPEWMDVEVSRDGRAWYYAGKAKHDVSPAEEAVVVRTLAVTLPKVEARYVRVSFPVKVFAFARQLEVWGTNLSRGESPSVLLPPENQKQTVVEEKTVRRVENMLLAYSGAYGERGIWRKEDFLPMVGYLTKDGYMVDQMFDTVLFLPYQILPSTKEGWKEYMNDLFRTGQQLEALNDAMREFNRLRGTLYGTPTVENVVLALPYPNPSQTDFGSLDDKQPSLSFNARQVGEEQAYENRKQALEWYYRELKKRWDKAGFAYLRLEGIYWFHELIDDSAPKERELIRHMAGIVHDDALRFYWIPYFGAPGLAEWKLLYFDYAFLQPNYYSDKPVQLDRLEGTLDVVNKYDMGVEIEGDERMYRDPKFYQLYYNQLVATHKLGLDKNRIHAYYFGSKTLLEAANSDDPVIRGIYDDTYKWMRGRFDRNEYFLPEVMP